MIANMNEKGRQTKLLAAVAVFAMVVCALAVVMPSAEAEDATELPASQNGVITLSENTTVSEDVVLTDIDLNLNGYTLTVKADAVQFNKGSTIMNGTIKFAGTVQFMDGSSAKNVTFASTAETDVPMTSVNYGADVTFDGCTFTNEKCTTAIYINSKADAASDVTITDCNISGNDDQLKEVIIDGARANVVIDGCDDLRINVTLNSNGVDTAVNYTYGSDLTVTDSVIDRVNVDANCTLTVPAGETLVAGMIRGEGTIANSGVVVANAFCNSDDTSEIAITGGVAYRIPVGMTATVDGNNVNVSGTPVAKGDAIYTALFSSANSQYSYAGIVGLTGTDVRVIQTNSALSAAWPDDTNFDDNVKDQNGYNFNTDKSYYFLVPMNGGTVTVQMVSGSSTTTYTFNFSVNGVSQSVSSVEDAQKALADENIDTVILDASEISTWTNVAFEVENTSKTLTIENLDNASFNVTTGSGTSVQTATFTGISASAISFTQGSIRIYGEDITAENGVVNVPAGVTVVIQNGTSFDGDGVDDKITFVGADSTSKVQFARNGTVALGGMNLVFQNVDVEVRGSVNGGTLTAGTGSTLTIDGTVTSSVVNAGGTIINNSVSGGAITLTDGTEIDYSSSITASITQEVIVTGTVTVEAGGYLHINGKLTIAEGANLILEEGANVTIYDTGVVDIQGTVTVAGSSTSTNGTATFDFSGSEMTVAGQLLLEGADSFEYGYGKIIISGSVIVGEEATATFGTGMTVATGGSLTVNGQLTNTTVVNNGTVTIDSEVAGNDVDVKIRNGGTLNIVNVVGTVDVTDEGSPYRIEGKDYTISAADANSMTFNNVAGITVTETLTVRVDPEDNTKRYADNEMFISGSVAAARNADGQTATGAAVTIVGGTVDVTETLDIGYIDFTINGTLDVSGTVNATTTSNNSYNAIDGIGILNVTGTVTARGQVEVNTINAAMYRTGTTSNSDYVYTTLVNAINAGATSITMLGTTEIESDVTIPAGTTVNAESATGVTIADGATVTVAYTDGTSGRFVNGSTEINVEGTLVVDNLRRSGLTESNVISDVATKNGDSAEYTSIYNALANAESGDTVTITREGTITLDRNITVGEGVTLVIPDVSTIVVDNGITVTVNGTVENSGTYNINADDSTTTAEDPGVTVVNGLFKSETGTDKYQGVIDGAYFFYDEMYCIAPLAFAAQNINDVEGNVTIYGDVTAGTVTANNTTGDSKQIIIAVGSTLTADDLNLEEVSLVFNGAISATVNVAEGTFVLSNVTGGSIVCENTYNADNTVIHTAVLSGTDIANATDVDGKAMDGSITVSGTARIDGATIGVDVTVAENSTVTLSGAIFNDVSATASVEADDNMVTVNGAVVIGKGTNTFNSDLTVIGTVAPEEGENYTATVKGNLYVGVNINTKTNVVAIISATASVNGLILGDSAVAYVAPGATVGESILDVSGMKSVEYFVNDEAYVAAYTRSTLVNIDAINANVTDARFDGWLNADGVAATTYDELGEPETHVTVGTSGFEQVYADIEVNVYRVGIVVDNSIGSVAIDGVMLALIDGVYTTIEPLAAGQHTVTYTLAAGYEGTPTLSSQNTTVSGMTFTVSGDYNTAYILGLGGATYAGSGSGEIIVNVPSQDDGMSLTDILLIVLVILILVMAIIVALRLMRS